MRGRKIGFSAAALAFAAFAALCGAPSVFAAANSAQSHFSGVDGSGAVMADAESPIVVEGEVLTFDLQSFPSNYYDSAEEFLAYDGKVTAQYTFYNPSEYTVTCKLLFPFGKLPDYYIYQDYDDMGNAIPADDSSKYAITVDGGEIEKEIRHTLSRSYEQFDVQRDLGLICDGFVEDEFYAPALPVTKYVFSVNGVDTEQYPAATVAADVSAEDGGRVFWFPEQTSGRSLGDGAMRAGVPVGKNGNRIEVFELGQTSQTPLVWKFYQNGGIRDGEEIAGEMRLEETQTSTFREFALRSWDETRGVLEHDWYNAVVAQLKSGQRSGTPLIDFSGYGKDFYNSLMRWYEYELTFAPNQRIVNTVTAPMYPDIDLAWKPPIEKYTYLLSPAKTWKSFGTLEIAIETPYFMSQCALEGFERTERGYVLHLDGLPDGELDFTLSTAEHPQAPSWFGGSMLGLFPYSIIAIAAGVALVAAGIIVTVIVVCRKKKKRH